MYLCICVSTVYLLKCASLGRRIVTIGSSWTWNSPKRCLSAPMGCVFAGGASALGGARGGAAVGGGGAAGVLGWKEGCLETTPVRQ